MDHNKKFLKSWECQTISPASCETYMQVKKQQLEPDMEQQTGPNSGAPHSHHTCVQSGKGTLSPGLLQDSLLPMIIKVSQNTDYVIRHLTAIPPSPRVCLWASRIFKVYKEKESSVSLAYYPKPRTYSFSSHLLSSN